MNTLHTYNLLTNTNHATLEEALQHFRAAPNKDTLMFELAGARVLDPKNLRAFLRAWKE